MFLTKEISVVGKRGFTYKDQYTNSKVVTMITPLMRMARGWNRRRFEGLVWGLKSVAEEGVGDGVKSPASWSIDAMLYDIRGPPPEEGFCQRRRMWGFTWLVSWGINSQGNKI